jgi:hypothetical protein
MEIAIVHAENVPEGCLLSLSAGGSRRQAPCVKRQKFAFSSSAAKALAAADGCVKVDVLRVHGSALISSPELPINGRSKGGSAASAELLEIERNISVPGADLPMNIKFALRPTQKPSKGELSARSRSREEEMAPQMEWLKSTSLLDGGSHKSGSRRHTAALEARAYLEQHGILPFVERLLRTLVTDRPGNPWTSIHDQLTDTAVKTALGQDLLTHITRIGTDHPAEKPAAMEPAEPAKETSLDPTKSVDQAPLVTNAVEEQKVAEVVILARDAEAADGGIADPIEGGDMTKPHSTFGSKEVATTVEVTQQALDAAIGAIQAEVSSEKEVMSSAASAATAGDLEPGVATQQAAGKDEGASQIAEPAAAGDAEASQATAPLDKFKVAGTAVAAATKWTTVGKQAAEETSQAVEMAPPTDTESQIAEPVAEGNAETSQATAPLDKFRLAGTTAAAATKWTAVGKQADTPEPAASAKPAEETSQAAEMAPSTDTEAQIAEPVAEGNAEASQATAPLGKFRVAGTTVAAATKWTAVGKQADTLEPATASASPAEAAEAAGGGEEVEEQVDEGAAKLATRNALNAAFGAIQDEVSPREEVVLTPPIEDTSPRQEAVESAVAHDTAAGKGEGASQIAEPVAEGNSEACQATAPVEKFMVAGTTVAAATKWTAVGKQADTPEPATVAAKPTEETSQAAQKAPPTDTESQSAEPVAEGNAEASAATDPLHKFKGAGTTAAAATKWTAVGKQADAPEPAIKAVTMMFTISGVEYKSMGDGHKTELKETLAAAIARTANVSQNVVSITLSQGSVKVDATILTSSTDMAKEVEGAVLTLQPEMMKAVSAIEGLPLTGNITVSEIKTSVTLASNAKKVVEEAPVPLATDDEASLRATLRSVLISASSEGRLEEAVSRAHARRQGTAGEKGSPVTIADAAREEELRTATRQLVLEANADGRLAAALTVIFAQEDRSGDQGRLEARDIILQASADGRSEAALDTLVGQDPFRLEARDKFLEASGDGRLQQALNSVVAEGYADDDQALRSAKGETASDDFRQEAQNMSLQASADGHLQEAISAPAPTVAANEVAAESGEGLRLHARGLFLQASVDGRLSEALNEEELRDTFVQASHDGRLHQALASLTGPSLDSQDPGTQGDFLERHLDVRDEARDIFMKASVDGRLQKSLNDILEAPADSQPIGAGTVVAEAQATVAQSSAASTVEAAIACVGQAIGLAISEEASVSLDGNSAAGSLRVATNEATMQDPRCQAREILMQATADGRLEQALVLANPTMEDDRFPGLAEMRGKIRQALVEANTDGRLPVAISRATSEDLCRSPASEEMNQEVTSLRAEVAQMLYVAAVDRRLQQTLTEIVLADSSSPTEEPAFTASADVCAMKEVKETVYAAAMEEAPQPQVEAPIGEYCRQIAALSAECEKLRKTARDAEVAAAGDQDLLRRQVAELMEERDALRRAAQQHSTALVEDLKEASRPPVVAASIPELNISKTKRGSKGSTGSRPSSSPMASAARSSDADTWRACKEQVAEILDKEVYEMVMSTTSTPMVSAGRSDEVESWRVCKEQIAELLDREVEKMVETAESASAEPADPAATATKAVGGSAVADPTEQTEIPHGATAEDSVPSLKKFKVAGATVRGAIRWTAAGKPQALEPAVVTVTVMEMKFPNSNFDELIKTPAVCGSIMQRIQEAVADKAVVQMQCVEVEMLRGSVVFSAAIRSDEGEKLRASMESDTTSWLQHVQGHLLRDESIQNYMGQQLFGLELLSVSVRCKLLPPLLQQTRGATASTAAPDEADMTLLTAGGRTFGPATASSGFWSPARAGTEDPRITTMGAEVWQISPTTYSPTLDGSFGQLGVNDVSVMDTTFGEDDTAAVDDEVVASQVLTDEIQKPAEERPPQPTISAAGSAALEAEKAGSASAVENVIDCVDKAVLMAISEEGSAVSFDARSASASSAISAIAAANTDQGSSSAIATNVSHQTDIVSFVALRDQSQNTSDVYGGSSASARSTKEAVAMVTQQVFAGASGECQASRPTSAVRVVDVVDEAAAAKAVVHGVGEDVRDMVQNEVEAIITTSVVGQARVASMEHVDASSCSGGSADGGEILATINSTIQSAISFDNESCSAGAFTAITDSPPLPVTEVKPVEELKAPQEPISAEELRPSKETTDEVDERLAKVAAEVTNQFVVPQASSHTASEIVSAVADADTGALDAVNLQATTWLVRETSSVAFTAMTDMDAEAIAKAVSVSKPSEEAQPVEEPKLAEEERMAEEPIAEVAKPIAELLPTEEAKPKSAEAAETAKPIEEADEKLAKVAAEVTSLFVVAGATSNSGPASEIVSATADVDTGVHTAAEVQGTAWLVQDSSSVAFTAITPTAQSSEMPEAAKDLAVPSDATKPTEEPQPTKELLQADDDADEKLAEVAAEVASEFVVAGASNAGAASEIMSAVADVDTGILAVAEVQDAALMIATAKPTEAIAEAESKSVVPVEAAETTQKVMPLEEAEPRVVEPVEAAKAIETPEAAKEVELTSVEAEAKSALPAEAARLTEEPKLTEESEPKVVEPDEAAKPTEMPEALREVEPTTAEAESKSVIPAEASKLTEEPKPTEEPETTQKTTPVEEAEPEVVEPAPEIAKEVELATVEAEAKSVLPAEAAKLTEEPKHTEESEPKVVGPDEAAKPTEMPEAPREVEPTTVEETKPAEESKPVTEEVMQSAEEPAPAEEIKRASPDMETFEASCFEAFEANRQLRSDNETLRHELEMLLSMTSPDDTPPDTARAAETSS